jgi:hypothetical protein
MASRAGQGVAYQDRRRERRVPGRPANGDSARCPRCDGVIEFSDRYRGAAVKGGTVEAMPAWVCDRCPYAYPVRAEHQSPVLLSKSRRLRAQAARKLMKSHAVLERAARALKKSLARKARG